MEPDPALSQARPWAPVDAALGEAGHPIHWVSSSTGSIAASASSTRHRRALVVVGAVTASALLVATVVAVPRLARTGVAHRALAGDLTASSPTRTSSASGGSAELTDAVAREAAITAVLVARGDAVTRHDPAGWRRTQIPAAKVPSFSRLSVLPFTQWVYAISSLSPGNDINVVDLDLRVASRLDVDTEDAIVQERMSMTHTAAGWRVTAEYTQGGRAQPWDLGTLTLVRGTRSLVIGIDTRTSVLREYADIADAVTPDVTAVWGSDWSRRPVLVVPHTVAQLGHALDRSAASLTGFAAVTTGEFGDLAVPHAAQRVWTNTPGMASMSSFGREIVVRHEITHVATAAPGSPETPLWLEEGFAEYVGYRGSGVPLGEALSELVTAERAGKAFRHLPTQAQFDGDQVDIAYESAHLACQLIAEKYGQKALVRFYRLTVAGTHDERGNVDAALRKVTGQGIAAFEAAWRDRVHALAS